MPKVSEIFSSTFFRAADLNGTSLIATIDGWSIEEAYGDEVYVVALRGQQKTLKLTNTNAKDIATLYGDDMGNWAGCEIEFYAEPMKIRDRDTGLEKIVDTIRVRRPGGSAPGGSAPTPADKPKRPGPIVPTKTVATPRNDLDDEIPY
jgi:hypothetical protein